MASPNVPNMQKSTHANIPNVDCILRLSRESDPKIKVRTKVFGGKLFFQKAPS